MPHKPSARRPAGSNTRRQYRSAGSTLEAGYTRSEERPCGARIERIGLTFSGLLAPHSIEEFAEHYFERKPLYIDRGGCDDYFAAFFSLAELERILYGSVLRTKDVRLVREGVQQRPETYTRLQKKKKLEEKKPPSDIIEPDRLSSLFSSGCTVVLDAMDQYSVTLSTLCRQLEAHFRHPINPNVYLTPPGSQGFAPHYDTHDTLILQVRGSKRWRVYGSAFDLPLDDQLFDKKVHPIGEPLMHIDMKPGDVLYLPRGFVHEGITNEDLSLHLTLGLHPYRWAQIIENAVNAVAERDVEWRKSPHQPPTDAELFSILHSLTPDEIRAAAERMEQTFVTERRNPLEGQLEQLANLVALNEDSYIALRPNLLYELTTADESTRLSFSHKTMIFGPGAAAVIGELGARSAVQISALLKHDEGALKVARRLIKEGFAIQLLGERKPAPQLAIA